jgi:hypothetical protein
MNEHLKSGKICEDRPTFEWMPALPGTPYSKIREHEQYEIFKHNPELNLRDGGGGKEPENLNYFDFGDAFSVDTTPRGRCAKGKKYIPIDERHGKTLYAVEDSGPGTLIKYILSKFIRFIARLIILALLLTVTLGTLEHFGIIDVVDIIHRFIPAWTPNNEILQIMRSLPFNIVPK